MNERDTHEEGLGDQLLPERLTVIERAGNFLVVNEDDPDDWVACFEQDARFPARDWAERMAELYNLRPYDEAERDPEKPPIFWGNHHPGAGIDPKPNTKPSTKPGAR